ncbi:MAG: ABC transporter permease [Ruminococcus sp.]|nr:ABC transporter permease [Ruminococcus sp.]
MIKLLRADMIRMFRSRTLHLMMLLFAGLIVLESALENTDYVEEGDQLFSGVLFDMGSMLLPMFVSIGICLIIGAEFTSGGIRNKMTVGHKRESIYGSWLICSFAITLAMTVILVVSSFAAALVFGIDMSDTNAKATVINLLVMTACDFGFTAVIVLFCTLFTGTKGVAVAFIYNETTMMIFAMLGEVYNTSEVYKLVCRFFIQAQMKFYNTAEITDTPWLTALCGGSLGVLATVAGIVSFKRKDLK